jgi:hypothetical protein
MHARSCMPVHACRFMHAACMPARACRSMHAGSCQLLLMRACAWRAYCEKCRVNLGSKRSNWPNVPVLISYFYFPARAAGGAAQRYAAEANQQWCHFKSSRCCMDPLGTDSCRGTVPMEPPMSNGSMQHREPKGEIDDTGHFVHGALCTIAAVNLPVNQKSYCIVYDTIETIPTGEFGTFNCDSEFSEINREFQYICSDFPE